ncbi:hypothetical protein CYANOKiyG1_49960 [Okeania sp. KiyG1]|nr:hypothetical protein CYANOKiyG1_49960 [Okeania sp. KiyG1]
MISCPRIHTLPDVGVNNPAKIDSKVVLPEPDGPINSWTSPLFTVKSIFFSTWYDCFPDW